jgi:carboxypeptidase PM20D1
MIKRVLLGLLGLLALLVAVLAINTLRQGSRQINVPPVAKLALDEQGVAERLGGAIRLQTIASRDNPEANAAEFEQAARATCSSATPRPTPR